MKTLILAGGLGTRFSEETDLVPKPMIDLGEQPILWHIMKIYSHHGFNDFVVLLGYRGYVIKEYFANYFLHRCDVTIDLGANTTTVHRNTAEPWRITLIDAGPKTQTGGRVLRAKEYVGNETFLLTYGDGVGDVNINSLVKFHQSHGKTATVTSVQPEGRFGSISSDTSGRIDRFIEKPPGDGAWINAGFFVCEPRIFDYLQDGDETILERRPLENLATDGEIFAFQHRGFWKCMDTQRDRMQLKALWESGKAPWKIWKD